MGRKIEDTIYKILSLASSLTNSSEIVEELMKILNRLGFTAPEAQSILWKKLSDVLVKDFNRNNRTWCPTMREISRIVEDR